MQFDDDHSSCGPEVILIAEGHGALQGSLKDLVMTELPDTPTVLIHAEESDDYQNSAIKAGAGSYVTKQKVAVELVPVLKKLLTAESRKDRGE